MIIVSFGCLALLYATGVLLALVAGRKEAGKPTGELHTPRWAFRALTAQIVLLLLTAPGLYSIVCGEAMASWTVIIGLALYSFPAVLSVIYYLSVLGDWLGSAFFGDNAPALPGAESADLDKARAAVARQDLPGGIALAEEYLRTHPDHLEAVHFLAVLEFKSKSYARCADLARRALALDAAVRLTNTGLIEEGRADLLALLADALERAGRPQDAAAELEQALDSLRVQRFRKSLAERAARLRGTAPKGSDS